MRHLLGGSLLVAALSLLRVGASAAQDARQNTPPPGGKPPAGQKDGEGKPPAVVVPR